MLTDYERKVLKAILESDFQNGYPVVYPVWMITSEDTGIEGRAHSGAVSSCSKKGYVWTDGETISITQLGYDTYRGQS
jgi:hypothetical protein